MISGYFFPTATTPNPVSSGQGSTSHQITTYPTQPIHQDLSQPLVNQLKILKEGSKLSQASIFLYFPYSRVCCRSTPALLGPGPCQLLFLFANLVYVCSPFSMFSLIVLVLIFDLIFTDPQWNMWADKVSPWYQNLFQQMLIFTWGPFYGSRPGLAKYRTFKPFPYLNLSNQYDVDFQLSTDNIPAGN